MDTHPVQCQQSLLFCCPPGFHQIYNILTRHFTTVLFGGLLEIEIGMMNLTYNVQSVFVSAWLANLQYTAVYHAAIHSSLFVVLNAKHVK